MAEFASASGLSSTMSMKDALIFKDSRTTSPKDTMQYFGSPAPTPAAASDTVLYMEEHAAATSTGFFSGGRSKANGKPMVLEITAPLNPFTDFLVVS